MRAVIDVGSNSILLLVAERIPQGWHPVLETTAVTGLGRGTKATGALGERGMADTLQAVKAAFEAARALGCQDITAAATMAARIAENTQEFLDRAEAQGTPIVVLSGEKEAEFGFLAVANDPMFQGEGRLTIIDPGGNSTELMTADRTARGWEVHFKRSYPVGALGLRDGILAPEVLGPRELLHAVAEIDDLIGLQYLPNQAGRVVVLGATGTNLISIREKLETWTPERVHGAKLDFEEVSKAVAWLSGMTDAERAQVPGLEKGRERTIHVGALILERFLQAIHVWEVRVSVRGWRHAMLEASN
jgi:exopolyphosphatase/guanosine-5'-triphosphate,3'-diphosphate pyrophosphatase